MLVYLGVSVVVVVISGECVEKGKASPKRREEIGNATKLTRTR